MEGRQKFCVVPSLWIVFCIFQPFVVPPVLAQSQKDFINIDCGYTGGSSYVDSYTGLTYVNDSQFTDTGKNYLTSSNPYVSQYGTLRSFPNSTRNCYKISPVQFGRKYLIRAGFYYGNYDGKSSTPIFDLHVGVNFWDTVLMGSEAGVTAEIITASFGEVIQVCLINTGKGTPFISVLQLRPLSNSLYPWTLGSQSMALQNRWNFGAAGILGYPDDPYDRIWFGLTNPFWSLNTTAQVGVEAGDVFQVPSNVLRTAVTGTTTNNLIIIPIWGTPGEKIYVVMHFAELIPPSSISERIMNINGGDSQTLLYGSYKAPYLKADHKEVSTAVIGRSGFYNISISVTSLSTLPYMINALESYIVRPKKELQTVVRDVSAMEDIKGGFKLTRNWQGDPCCPRQYAWEGVGCNYDSGVAMVISLNVSSSGLDGTIPSSIGKLTDLVTLDVSYNSLKGKIPDTFEALSSLKILNITGNEALGAIPRGLCQRASTGDLFISIPDWPSKCVRFSNKKKIMIPVIGAASVTIIILLFVSIWIIKRKSKALSIRANADENNRTPTVERQEISWGTKNPKFTFEEIVQITQNFRCEIGKGGFGPVYFGYLRNETKVAVKVLSSSSAQGNREFQAEVELLARAHHKNLVTLIGYCDDTQNLSLVYEYMDNGTLRDHIAGAMPNFKPLNWSQRVSVALQAAQGLDYLHNGCRPPIIHRDIKSANILLTGDFVAKIADFGLSRAFRNDNLTHVTTKIAGTPGYLDPLEFQNHGSNEKSDVYSFGVVLLEILTGETPYVLSAGKMHIVRWVSLKIQAGGIRNVIDPSLKGNFDINVAWKMIEVARACTSINSEERMTMSKVVVELKQCLEMGKHQNILEDVSTSSLSEVYPFASYAQSSPAAR